MHRRILMFNATDPEKLVYHQISKLIRTRNPSHVASKRVTRCMRGLLKFQPGRLWTIAVRTESTWSVYTVNKRYNVATNHGVRLKVWQPVSCGPALSSLASRPHGCGLIQSCGTRWHQSVYIRHEASGNSRRPMRSS